jgi:tRNA A-37 threonylcarbamoyl transferase component Bud32
MQEMGITNSPQNISILSGIIRRQLADEKLGKTSNMLVPKRPQKLMGVIRNESNIAFYYVLDVINGKLLKFNQRQDINTKIEKAIILSKIRTIKMLEKLSGKDFVMELTCDSYKQRFYSNSKHNLQIWLNGIQEAMRFNLFINYIEEKIYQKGNIDKDLNDALKLLKNEKIIVCELDGDLLTLSAKTTSATVKSTEMATPLKQPTPITYSKSGFTTEKDEQKIDEGSEKVNINSFILLEKIGQGAFGKIFKVQKKDNGQIYALKVLSKEFLNKQDQLKYAIAECNILKMITHPFIITLHYSFQTSSYLYFVLDYCDGGDLETHLAKRGLFEEKECRFFMAQLVLAIEHLHTHHIIYRDLKPGNILLDSKGNIRLGDFGLAKENVKDEGYATTFCGSPAYISPELITNKTSNKVSDIYQIGVVMYELLVGFPPFFTDDVEEMYKRKQEYTTIEFPEFVSSNAKDLILKMLEKDPLRRITIVDSKKHAFFKGIDWAKLCNKQIKSPFTKTDIMNKDSDDEEQISVYK